MRRSFDSDYELFLKSELTEVPVKKEYNRITEKPHTESQTKENRRLVQRWLEASPGFDFTSDHHIRKCIAHTANLDATEQDKFVYVLQSKAFQDWLREPRSPLLHVKAETAPSDIINFMSTSTASLASSLGSGTDFAVLSFFCGLRKNASLAEDDSGVLGMLKSLNGQVLDFILEKHSAVDLPSEDSYKLWRKSPTSIQYAWRLFKSLLLSLPHHTVVFILLHSVSRVSGDKTRVDDLVKRWWTWQRAARTALA